MVAEIGKPRKEAVYGFAGVEPAEIVGAEVCRDNAVGEHVPHCGEHRSGNGEDGFLGAASYLDGQELGVQIGAKVGACVGLVPQPWDSGESQTDQGISRQGNRPCVPCWSRWRGAGCATNPAVQ